MKHLEVRLVACVAGGHCSRQPELVPTQLLLLLELLLASVDAAPQHLLLGFSLSDWCRTCASLGSSALLLVPQARGVRLVPMVLQQLLPRPFRHQALECLPTQERWQLPQPLIRLPLLRL